MRVINIGIFEEQEGYTIYYDYDIDNMLGTYATKERALEVLDEIQCLVNINDSKDSYFYVYEMPKE
jgi:AAA+ ATPase superfamily predicted ATPase